MQKSFINTTAGNQKVHAAFSIGTLYPLIAAQGLAPQVFSLSPWPTGSRLPERRKSAMVVQLAAATAAEKECW